MTEERLSNVEDRLDRVEELLLTTGNYLQEGVALARLNAAAIDQLTPKLDRIAERQDRNAEAIDRLTVRIDSLTAASERHDRILDYLLGQGEDSGNSNN